MTIFRNKHLKYYKWVDENVFSFTYLTAGLTIWPFALFAKYTRFWWVGVVTPVNGMCGTTGMYAGVEEVIGFGAGEVASCFTGVGAIGLSMH